MCFMGLLKCVKKIHIQYQNRFNDESKTACKTGHHITAMHFSPELLYNTIDMQITLGCEIFYLEIELDNSAYIIIILI